jgi:lipopolysaccharide/colanic/teichoic acid biosynthesis glycosyltransferase
VLAWQGGDAGEAGQLYLVIYRFCLVVGSCFLVQSLLIYMFASSPVSPMIVVGGCALALLIEYWISRRAGAPALKVIVVGEDLPARQLVQPDRKVLGFVEVGAAKFSRNERVLGVLDQLGSICEQHKPDVVLIALRDWEERISPAQILALAEAEIAVEWLPDAYERRHLRIDSAGLAPRDLIRSPGWTSSRQALAIQAVYGNVVGLGLLVLCAPILLIASVLVAITSGGRVMEPVSCAGFRGVPFSRMRFRVRDDSGHATPGGWLIEKLGLTGLPMLINVVRGEMALVGPRPVRLEFASYLDGLLPLAYHRRSVKPGVTGWAQVNSTISNDLGATEPNEFEYDVYYLREGSWAFDVEIIVRSLLRGAVASG